MSISDPIQLLIALQEERGWSNQEVADRLGVDRSYWSLAKIGRRRPGIKMLRGIARGFDEFPELRDAAVFFLTNAVSEVAVA